MITREELRRIPELYKSIQRDKEHLAYLREKATSVPSTLKDQERVQSSPNPGVNKYVEAAADLSREIGWKQTCLDDLTCRASLFIETIQDDLARKVMEYRYVKCYEWNEIADVMGYAMRYLQQIEWEEIKNLIPPHTTSCV